MYPVHITTDLVTFGGLKYQTLESEDLGQIFGAQKQRKTPTKNIKSYGSVAQCSLFFVVFKAMV